MRPSALIEQEIIDLLKEYDNGLSVQSICYELSHDGDRLTLGRLAPIISKLVNNGDIVEDKEEHLFIYRIGEWYNANE